jgi:hypothetical protein
MPAITTGARAAAAAAIALGFSLAGLPVGIAGADTPDGGDAHSSSADADAGATTPARPGRQGRAARTPRAADGSPTAIAQPNSASEARSAAVEVAPPTRPARQRPSAAIPPATQDAPVAVAANDPLPQPIPAAVAEAPAPVHAAVITPPAVISEPPPFDAAVPQWVSARDWVPPAPAVAPPHEVRGVASAVQSLLDSVGTMLANLPVTPFTDFVSGALWLTRRALVPVGSGLGSPAACGSTCASEAISGQVLIVTNAVDGQAGSLRDVLAQASSGDVIRFAPRLRHATLTLTEGELDVNESVRIEGTQQTLDAAGQSRIMLLDEPGTAISLSGLTFRNGSAAGDPVRGTMGGAILADSVNLEICGSRFSGNAALASQPGQPDDSYMQSGLGGAIAATNSTVSITDSEFTGNTAAGADNSNDQQASSGLGGAIFAANSPITMQRTRFRSNSAVGGSGATPIEPFPTAEGGWGAGGAIFADGASVAVTNVTFEKNSATGGDGLSGSASNPFRNGVGAGGKASGGALWMAGRGQYGGDPVQLDLTRVEFTGNSAVGGSAGAQGLATLGPNQGGRVAGGALGAVNWVQVAINDVTFVKNLGEGGGVGDNAPGSGSRTGTGGVVQGGAAFLDSPASVAATHLTVDRNTARGGKGADSAAGSGTEAGEGGFAYCGGVLISNSTGGLSEQPATIPLTISQSVITGNRVIGGEPGAGPAPANRLGAGGLAQGGGMTLSGTLRTTLIGLRFIGNAAIGGLGKPAQAGGLINPYGQSVDPTATLTIVNSLFRNNQALGGDDATNPVYRRTLAGGFLNNSTGTQVSGSRFVGNSAVGGNDTGSGYAGTAEGGGMYTGGQQPSITLSDTTFQGNSALGGRRLVPGESAADPFTGEASGGAFYGANGVTTINGGSFVHNQATVRIQGDRSAMGGAVALDYPTQQYSNELTTNGVRFSSNTAQSKTGSAGGGAIAHNATTFTDNSSTFSGNSARSGHFSGSAYGGALLLQQVTTLNGTTVTFNNALADQGYGGGVAVPPGPDYLTQALTTIRFNRASTEGDDLWWPATAATND